MCELIKSTETHLIVRLMTDLKMENAREHYEQFLKLLKETHTTIIIDFSRIKFIDSSGVGILLKCADHVRERNGEFIIYGLNRSILTVFKLAGLLKIFKVLEEEEALTSFPELLD